MTQDKSNIMTRFCGIGKKILHLCGSKQAELKQRLASDEITARCQRDYGSCSTRLRLVISLLLIMVLGVSEVWGQTNYAIYVAEKGYLKNVTNEHETDFTNFATNSKWTFTAEGKLKCGTVYLKDNGTTITTTESETEATVWTKETSGVKSYFKTSDDKYMKSGWLLSEGVSEEDDRYVGYEVKGDDRVIWIPAGTYVLVNKNIDYGKERKEIEKRGT